MPVYKIGLTFFLKLSVFPFFSKKLFGLTEVDDSDPGCVRCDDDLVNNRLDKVEYQLPVVASWRVVVTYTSRVVNHECKVDGACCNDTA